MSNGTLLTLLGQGLIKINVCQLIYFWRSLEYVIPTVKGQNNFWYENAFLTCSWRFLISNKLEQLEFKLEKNIGVEKHAGKVRKEGFFSHIQRTNHCKDGNKFLLGSNLYKRWL